MKFITRLSLRQNKLIPVIVVFAPTASGKTSLAVELFGKDSNSSLRGMAEVVSADSQAVYRHFDIGTAKPNAFEQSQIKHHLIDIVSPEIQFGLGDFMPLADSLCSEIYSRKKIPLVIGGTGFYIRNFLLGCPKTPESNPKVRESVKKELSEHGKKALYDRLLELDPVCARKINVNDEYRICRALEVFYSSGKPLSSFALPENLRKEYDFCTIILNRPREELYDRINRRVDEMFENGLADEVEKLRKMGYDENTPAMKAIGYSEFFLPNLTNDGIRDKIKHDSHRYAKKQYTFMKGIPGAVVVDADDKNEVEKIISCKMRTWEGS